MKTGIWVLAAALAAAAPANAHHSFAMFDQAKTATLSATVKEFQWTNPHVWLQLVTADGQGGVQEWGIEASTPSMLGRNGWSRHSFAPGDKVTVVIHPMKSGEHGGSFISATFADGHSLHEVAGLAANSPQVGKP